MAIVTFTTDFGLSDAYVASMKAAVLRNCPGAHVIDITHLVPRHDIVAASIALERAVDSFNPQTVHLAVVDPGVGSDRRILIARLKEQTIVCPDNGLITWAWRRHGPGLASELLWRPKEFSSTFHGRDILAPAAGKLAAGESLQTRPIPPVLLPIKPASEIAEAQIIHIDHFGNATTNVAEELCRGRAVKGIGAILRTYSDVQVGKPIALIGSSGLLEIAVREGSAAQLLGLKIGDKVILQ